MNTPTATAAPTNTDRVCAFELDLTCGHCVTVRVTGWYPVSVDCCDRLGGAWFDGTYYPAASDVEYARCLSERYVDRSPGAQSNPIELLGRRARTDDPLTSQQSWQSASAGRFPVRVGAPRPSVTEGARA